MIKVILPNCQRYGKIPSNYGPRDGLLIRDTACAGLELAADMLKDVGMMPDYRISMRWQP